MADTRANRNAERCPSCGKSLTRGGRAGKSRCCNPECPVVFVESEDKCSRLPNRGR